MNPNDILGETIEKGQKTVKQTASAVSDAAKIAVGQAAEDKAQTEELVKDLYAPSKPKNAQNLTPAKPESKAEEQARLASVRQKLHDEVYYQPLINRQKPQEERPAEKVEKEKKQELMDLQKKEAKKPAPIAVQRAQQTAEKFRGVSG